MPEYKNGKIYAIRSHQTTNIYIGSTTRPLSQRLGKHRYCYNNNLNKSSMHILKYPDYYIELIETFACNSKDELEKKEGEYIRQFKDICVNVIYPQRTPAEYYEDHKDEIKEYKKKYQQQHKDELNQKSKEYHQQHKDEQNQKAKEYNQLHKEEKKIYDKEYRQQHKEKLKEQKKEHYQDHKEEINKKYNCECGGKYIHSSKARHLKTTKHKNYLANTKIV